MATRTFDRLDPLTGQVAGTAPAATVADANAAGDRAQRAFPAWTALGPNARQALLNRAADALDAQGDALVAAMKGEIRATEGRARFNHQLAVGIVREAASMTTRIGGEVIPSDKPGLGAYDTSKKGGSEP